MVSRRFIISAILLDGTVMFWWSDLAWCILLAMPRVRCLGNRLSYYRVGFHKPSCDIFGAVLARLSLHITQSMIIETFHNLLKLLPLTATAFCDFQLLTTFSPFR